MKASQKLSSFISSATSAISSKQASVNEQVQSHSPLKSSPISSNSKKLKLMDFMSKIRGTIAQKTERSFEQARQRLTQAQQRDHQTSQSKNQLNVNSDQTKNRVEKIQQQDDILTQKNHQSFKKMANFIQGMQQKVKDKQQNRLAILVEKLNPKNSEPERIAHRATQSLSKFMDGSLSSIVNKNSNSFDLFNQKLSVIKHIQSVRSNEQSIEMPIVKETAKQKLKPTKSILRTQSREFDKPKSSTKSIKLNDLSNDEQEPFNLTIKTRLQNSRPPQDPFQNNDSLAYSHSQFTKMDSFQRRITSPDRRVSSPTKKLELEQIQDEQFIPKQLKYTEKELQPDSPKKIYVEQIIKPTKFQLIKQQVEEMKKKSHIQIEKPDEQLQEDEKANSYSPPKEQEISRQAIRQVQTVNVTPHQSEMFSNKSIRKHKFRIQKDIQDSKSSRANERIDSIQSRIPSEQSQYPNRKRISSNDNKKDFSKQQPSGNIFSTQIESIKQRINLLHQAKSRKKFLQIQLSDVNNEISNLRKVDEDSNAKRNKIKEFIGISDDHQARVKAAQLVMKLNKEKAKRQKSIIEGFSKVDNSILDSINQLAKIRQQREKKVKEQKKIEILERMKQHQRKKQQDQRLKDANKMFVIAIKNQHPTYPSNPTNPTRPDEPQTMPQSSRYRKQPTQHSSRTPDIHATETPELNLKKEKLKKIRHFNYVSKKSILQDYNAALF